MDVLVPADGSETSFRALSFGVELARRFEGSIHVVHFSDAETEATDEIAARAREVLDESGAAADSIVEVSIDVDLDLRPNAKVGEDILELVAERGYDHVVMGHHGAGTVERAILGSAAETVVRAETVPVTVVP